jgi:hypothetical protein
MGGTCVRFLRVRKGEMGEGVILDARLVDRVAGDTVALWDPLRPVLWWWVNERVVGD